VDEEMGRMRILNKMEEKEKEFKRK